MNTNLFASLETRVVGNLSPVSPALGHILLKTARLHPLLCSPGPQLAGLAHPHHNGPVWLNRTAMGLQYKVQVLTWQYM